MRAIGAMAMAGTTAVVLTVLCVLDPRWALLGAAAVTGVTLLFRPQGRFVFVVGGALLVLQGDAIAPKIAYLAGLLVCLGVAAPRLRDAPDFFRPVLGGSAIALAAVVLSALVASVRGVSTIDWFRDALPYALLGLMPVLALDAARGLSTRWVERAFALFGIAAGIAFMLAWLERRGVATIAADQVALASFALPAAACCFAIAKGVRGSWIWVAVAALISATLLITGTRSALILVFALLGLLGSRHKGRLPPAKLVMTTVAVVGGIVVILSVAGSRIVEHGFIEQRFGNIASLVFAGQLQNDTSFRVRQDAYTEALAAFLQHPVLGTGPGHLYPTFNPTTPVAFTLDTPLATPAKFGLLGASAFAVYLVAWYVAFRRRIAARGYAPVTTALRCAAFVFLASLPFGVVLEDKGFALAVFLFAVLFLSLPTGADGQRPARGRAPSRQPTYAPIVMGIR